MLFSILGAQTFSPGNWHKQFRVSLGLDLSSGTEVVLTAATAKGAPPPSGEMQAAISVLLSRVNGTGNSGAQVAQQGSNQLTVTVPGQPPQSTITLIESTAKLAFRPVLYEVLYSGTTTTPTVTPSSSPSASGTGSPSASPSSSAKASTSASPTPSAGASAGASTSASPKASTAAFSERLASPSASPTAKASSAAKASATPKASATAKASATPSPTATASTAAAGYGNASAVTAANLKLLDKMVCQPGPNADTVNPSWKQTIAGYTPALSPGTT